MRVLCSELDRRRFAVTVSIAARAADGPRDVTIDNHDGGAVTCRACFNVLSRPRS